MKLALPLLLLALALCCPDANAKKVCPALENQARSFFLDPVMLFDVKIHKFNAPAPAKEAAMQLKACVDKLSLLDRLAMNQFVRMVNSECNKHVS